MKVYRKGILGWAKKGLPLISSVSYPKVGIPLIVSKDLYQSPKDSAVLLDIRPRGHFQNGHIPGSINIDLEDLPDHLDVLSNDKNLILVDHKGKLTLTTGRYLFLRGFKNIMRLDGGFNAWVKNGLPVSRFMNAAQVKK